MSDRVLPLDTTLSASETPHLVQRARDLVPFLRSHADAADRTGELAESVVNALSEAEFFTLRVPRSVGGIEADLNTTFEVFRELAHGCGSSAWVAMILSGSSLMASMLGDEARKELWGTDTRTAVCSCLPVCGTARGAEGGITITGKWLPASGVHHCEWAVVAAAQEGTDPVLAVVPVAAGRIERTWDVAGMRATRSDTLAFDEVFVPAHRVLPFSVLLTGGQAAGNPDELQSRTPFMPAAMAAVAAPLLGMAEAALEHTVEWLGQRDNRRRVESPPARYALAEAAACVESARLRLHSVLDDVERHVGTAAAMEALALARVRMLVASAAADIRESVHKCLTVFGSAGYATGNPVQRIWRDIEIATTHPMVSLDRAREEYSQVLIASDAASAVVTD